MGMTGNVAKVSDSQVAALLSSPEDAPGFLSEAASDGRVLDLDKAWHGIHFLLAGDIGDGDPTRPEAFVLGGTPVGDVDVGYGPARAFTSEEVQQIATVLEALPREKLVERCDADAFEDSAVYPQIWDEPFDDCFGYVLGYYEDLRQFVHEAAEGGDALLVWLW